MVGAAAGALAGVAVVVAGKGVADGFYISPTSEALAREAAGERLIVAAAILLAVAAVGLTLARWTWSAAAAGLGALLFLVDGPRGDQSLLTYAMVPLVAVLLVAGAAVDAVRRRRPVSRPAAGAPPRAAGRG